MLICGPLGVWRGVLGGFPRLTGLGYFAPDRRRWRLVARDILVEAFFCVVVAREALCHGGDGGQELRPGEQGCAGWLNGV